MYNHSTKPELRFCTGSNPACSVSEIRDGEDLRQWSRLEIRLNVFRRSPKFIIIIMIIIIIIIIIRLIVKVSIVKLSIGVFLKCYYMRKAVFKFQALT